MEKPLLAIFFLIFVSFTCSNVNFEKTDEKGLSPEEALLSFEILSDFRIESIVSEPMIADPVAMAINEWGHMYVVEMPGYPLDTGNTGKVKLLMDTDEDGLPDEVHVFADDLVLPTGIMPWKKGVMVTDPPHLIYLEDTDGDHLADKREIVLTGFARSNPQHNMNKPLYGIDNWIYLANNNRIWTENFKEQFGDSGSEVKYPDREEPKLGQNAESRSVRLRPDSFELESLSSDSQFGHTFDKWGRYFQVDNSHPGFNEVIAQRYLDRKSNHGIKESMAYIPSYAPQTDVFPITKNPQHQLLTDRGVFTSAAGINYYKGGSFGTSYEDLIFIAEPVHNLVHADRVQSNGATFSSTRLLEKKEFLASTDPWFRPVNFYVGPDGALYVVDYYRRIVEHPEWMDDETANSGKLGDGTSQGRIYRITPKGKAFDSWSKGFSENDLQVDQLVQFLNHKNYWWRINAQRLLLDQNPEEAGPKIRDFLVHDANASARVHALWSLSSLGIISSDEISMGLKDGSAGVQENAIKIAELHLDKFPKLLNELIALSQRIEMDDLKTRRTFQLLLTLGGIDSPQSNARTKAIIDGHAEDSWFLTAARTALSPDVFPNIEDIALYSTEGKSKTTVVKMVSESLVMANKRDDLATLLLKVVETDNSDDYWWNGAVLDGIADGLRLSNNLGAVSQAQTDMLVEDALISGSLKYIESVSSVTARLRDLNPKLEISQLGESKVLDPKSSNRLQASALKLLGNYAEDAGEKFAESCIGSDQSQEVQLAAVDVLRQKRGLHQLISDKWSSLGPKLRTSAIDLYMNDDEGRMALLDHVEAGRILPSTVGWNRRVRLMRDTKGEVKAKARAVLTVDDAENYTEKLEAALALTGSELGGAEIFKQHCASCHLLGGEKGYAFGPDLSTIRHWPNHHLLQGIVNPNKSIADGYEFWIVETNSGETVAGVIKSENSNSLTLQMQGGIEKELLRSEISSISSLGTSAMPEGLAAPLSAQNLADLVAFIKN